MNTDQAERIRIAGHLALIPVGVLAVFFILYIAESVFKPTILALTLGVVLSPLSDFWERLGLPRGISALISLVFTLIVIMVLAALLLPVAERVVASWPAIMAETRDAVVQFQSMIQGIESAGEQVERAIGNAAQAGENAAQGGGDLGIPTTADALFLAPTVLGQSITFAGILFFFLLTRVEIYAWLAQHLSPESMELETARRLRQAEREVARYFLTIAIVNLGFGICVTIAMTLLEVPAPLLWGTATFLLNFVLYLGPAVVFFALLLTGLVAFEGSYAVVPALVFLSFNMIEAQFVTPSAIGRTMKLNPALVFFALVFFLWLWGPIGGFVSIPLLLWGLTLAKEITATRRDIRKLAGNPKMDIEQARQS